VSQPGGSESVGKTGTQKKASHAKPKPKRKPRRRHGTRAKGGGATRSRAHGAVRRVRRSRSTGTRELSEK
jgi:hypothetical protein